MKLFYYLARNISYTFAIAFYSVFVGWTLGIFAVFIGSSLIIFPYDRLVVIAIKWVTPAALITGLLHYIHSGFLTPIKVPAFLKSHRSINTAFKNNFNISDNEYDRMYLYVSDLPMHSMIASVLYTALTGLIILVISFYELKVTKFISIEEIKVIYKIFMPSLFITMIFYGMSSYLFAETLTNNERSLLYNALLKKGYRIKLKYLIGIRLKFMFFVILMIIAMLSYAAFMEKSRYYEQYKIEIIIIYLIISIIAAFFIMQITIRSILKILSDLRRVTKEIASGGKASFHVLSLEKEFAAIEYALMEMAWEIDEYRVNLERKVEMRTEELQEALINLKGRDDQIQRQLDMASIIQRSILPRKIDDWNELKFSVRYIAMEKIGGDFYDVFQLKDNKLGIIIADVSGHGIPAALVTTMAKISFGNAGTKYDSPKKIFQEVNQNIMDHVKTQDYLTCFMLIIDDDYNVLYSNASHQKAILLKTNMGTIELLDTNGLFIGAIESARDSYDEKSTKLEYGDRIILYTDGIPEAINDARKEYSNKRLEDVILANRHLNLEEFSTRILEDVQQFIGKAQVMDDITFLVLELVRDEAIEIIKDSKKLVNAHKYYEAIEALESGLSKYHDNQKILYNLAKNYFRLNDYNKTIHNIKQYIDNDKRNKNAFYIAGASYYQMQDYNNSIEYFEKALELDSNFVNALFALGMSHKKMGDMENAVRIFERVINIDPDNMMALFELKEMREGK